MHVISCALTHTHSLSLSLSPSPTLILSRSPSLALSFFPSISFSLSLPLSLLLSLPLISISRVQAASARTGTAAAGGTARTMRSTTRRFTHHLAASCDDLVLLVSCTVLQCVAVCCSVLQCRFHRALLQTKRSQRTNERRVLSKMPQCVAVCCSVAFIGLFCKRSDHNARTKDVYSQRCRMPRLTCSDDESIVFACYLFGRTNWQRLRFFALSLPLRVCSAERCCCAPLCASGSGAVRQQRGASACDPRHDMCRHTPGAQRD